MCGCGVLMIMIHALLPPMWSPSLLPSPPLPSPPLSSLVPQSNNNLKPKEGEVTSRPWQWPLNMRVSTVHSLGWARGSKSTDHVHM